MFMYIDMNCFLRWAMGPFLIYMEFRYDYELDMSSMNHIYFIQWQIQQSFLDVN